MSRSNVVEEYGKTPALISETLLVQRDGPAIRVRQYIQGTRHFAELSTGAAVAERAIIDAGSAEELARIIEPAARSFSASVRLRHLFR